MKCRVAIRTRSNGALLYHHVEADTPQLAIDQVKALMQRNGGMRTNITFAWIWAHNVVPDEEDPYRAIEEDGSPRPDQADDTYPPHQYPTILREGPPLER